LPSTREGYARLDASNNRLFRDRWLGAWLPLALAFWKKRFIGVEAGLARRTRPLSPLKLVTRAPLGSARRSGACVDEIGEPDLEPRSNQADRARNEAHQLLPMREYMLDGAARPRLPRIGESRFFFMANLPVRLREMRLKTNIGLGPLSPGRLIRDGHNRRRRQGREHEKPSERSREGRRSTSG
jgi:hypothetical protein